MKIQNTKPNCVLYATGSKLAFLDLETGVADLFSLLTEKKEATKVLKGKKPLLCFAPDILAKIKNNFGLEFDIYFDILQLHAFLFPTSFISPSIKGLCGFYKIDYQDDITKDIASVFSAYNKMLGFVAKTNDNSIEPIARYMIKDNWVFSSIILNAMQKSLKYNKTDAKFLEVWQNIPKVEKNFLKDEFTFSPLAEESSQEEFENILQSQNHAKRPKQEYYLKNTKKIFESFDKEEINTVLAQAETGTGKTLAYLSNAIAFAKQNNFPVVFSTYTIVLQNQILKQMQKLAQKGIIKKQDIVVRKGKENYVCLLNYKSILGVNFKRSSIANGFLARWLLYTKDGDFKNGDFISWLKILIDNNIIYSITDQEGQCIGKSCPFYDKCYIEHIKNKSLTAKYLIVNHATLLSNLETLNKLSNIYVIDEAHHLLSAADSNLSDILSIKNSYFLRKWMFGSSDLIANNKAGLDLRFKDILSDGSLEKVEQIKDIFHNLLPSSSDANTILMQVKNGFASTFLDSFFAKMFEYIQELSKESDKTNFYSLQSNLNAEISQEFKEVIESLLQEFDKASLLISSTINDIEATKEDMKSLFDGLYQDKENDAKKKLEEDIFKCGSLSQGLANCVTTFFVWKRMIKASFLNKEQEVEDKKVFSFVGLIEKEQGVVKDICLQRVFKDPGYALSQSFFAKHGKNVLLTSATLKSPLQKEDKLANKYGLYDDSTIKKKQFFIDSDFNYKENSLVLIVNDYTYKSSVLEKSLAMKDLIKASNGGALALFTSINRLKESYKLLNNSFEKENINFYAQHVNKQELYSLMHMFKEDENSCLLGTDAIRDGIDIPGNSLRMVIYEKVPWQNKTVLLQDRKEYFGKSYEDDIICAHLKQAFGRLIRSKDDKGVFVMLDSMFPSRYKVSFPENVTVKHVSLTDALFHIKDFFKK